MFLKSNPVSFKPVDYVKPITAKVDISAPIKNDKNEKNEKKLIEDLKPKVLNTFENKILATTDNEEYEVNPVLKAKFQEALKSKDNKRHFQVIYIFKNKIKRMYRIDCMTRKINV
jgi:hypothetical protein